MINFSFGPNTILALILGSGVIILYLLRVVKPEVAREEDIFFTTIGLLYCGILIVHGWRLDPILLFSQVLIITAVFVTTRLKIQATIILQNFEYFLNIS